MLTEQMQIEPVGAPSGRLVAGVGRVLLWNGASLWIGREAGHVQQHAHHAIQIALAMSGRFRMRGGDESDWAELAGAIVMPHHSHRFDGCGSSVAMLFVEPETTHGRALVERHRARGIAELPLDLVEGLVTLLRSGFAARVDDEALMAASRQAIATLAGSALPAEGVDPRIGRVIEWVRQRLDVEMSLNEAAAAVHLSPSRFRHLFVAQTGVTFRAYVLWARVEFAVAAAMAGRSWTAAAQEAGFADSAHLSRTCRRMFGVAPATLVRD